MKLEDELSDIRLASDILDTAPVAMDLVTSICGNWIATGVFRSVYDYNLDDKYVVKIEKDNTSCNMIEYMIWDEVRGLINDKEWVKDWFAPCKWISPNGRILIMEKTKEFKRGMEVPTKVPEFLWDVKPDNFGWIGKNYVCHDYGQLYNMIHYPKKFKKIIWE